MGSIFDNRIDYNGVGVHSASGTHIIKKIDTSNPWGFDPGRVSSIIKLVCKASIIIPFVILGASQLSGAISYI